MARLKELLGHVSGVDSFQLRRPRGVVWRCGHRCDVAHMDGQSPFLPAVHCLAGQPRLFVRADDNGRGEKIEHKMRASRCKIFLEGKAKLHLEVVRTAIAYSKRDSGSLCFFSGRRSESFCSLMLYCCKTQSWIKQPHL